MSKRILVGAGLAVLWMTACGGEEFESAVWQPSKADAQAEGSVHSDAGEAGQDAGADKQVSEGDAPTADLQPLDAGRETAAPEAQTEGAATMDVQAEPTCEAKSLEIEAEADGMIMPEGSNCGASISFTTSGCMDLNLEKTSRVIIRFVLPTEARAALQAQAVTSATLSFQLVQNLKECDSTLDSPAANASGPISVYPLRSDWTEGESYQGAQWCYRKGNGSSWEAANKWSDGGASGAEDHGSLMSATQLKVSTPVVELPLDSAALGPWLTGAGKVSMLVTPDLGSSVLAYIRTKESGIPAKLRLVWCD